MTQVNAVNIKKIPQLTEVLELPSNADIPIYDPATGVTGRIKAALLKGGEEIKTNWASTTTYAIDAVVEFQLKLWKSLINNNTGNTPVEGSNWTEVSKSSGNGYGYWSAGVFTQDPSMVIRSGGLFLLDNTKVTLPFNSTDFETEYNAGIWVQPTGHEAGVITADTTNFNKNLTSEENTVQKALDKIDDLDIPQTTTIDIDTLEPYNPLLTYDAGVYKSYVNLESSDTQFHDPAIYLSMFDVPVGSSPETDPYSPEQNAGFWWYLGTDPVEVTSRSTAKTTVFSEGELRAIEGAKSGDTCNILDSYLNIEIIYKFDINSTASEIPYQVVKPLDGIGRWLSQGIKNLQPSFASYSLPYSAGFNYGLSPNKIHYYKAVDLRPNAQLFVTSTFASTSSLYRSEEYAIFIDNSINTVDLAIILNIDSSLIEWVDGVSTSVIKAGKKVYLTAKWMLVSTGVYKLLIRVDPVNEEVSGISTVEDLGVITSLTTKKVLKVNATGDGVDYTDYDFDQVLNTDSIDVTDPTWMESEERLLLVKKVSGAPAFEGAAALVDIFAPPGVEPTLRDNTGWTNDVKTITGDNSTYALGQKGQVIWLNDHVYCQCTSATYAVSGSATYTRNRNIDVLDPATSTQDAAMANALDPSYTYPAMTVTGNSTDVGWDLITQTKVVTSLPVKLGSWFVGGISGAGYEYHCFAVNGTTSYWKRRGTPDSYQRPIYAATHPTLTAHILAHDFSTSAYTQVVGDEATYADQTFYDATTRAYFIKMINGNWEKLR